VLGMPLWGMLRDRIGWSRTLALGAITNAALAAWFFQTIPGLDRAGNMLLLDYAVLGLGAGCVHAMMAGLVSSLFPTAVRQSGYALPYSFGTAIFSGLTPLTLAWLVRDYGLAAPLYQALAGCLVALSLAALVRFMPRYLGEASALSADEAQSRQLAT